MTRPRTLPFALLALLTVTACSDTELVGIHINLAKDGTGTLTARALQSASAPGPAEARTHGVQWQMRANLCSSQGTFRSIADLALGDREVRFTTSNDEMPHLRVVIKRDRDLAWVQALVPDQDTRRALARVHDPNTKSREIADVIRLEVQFPDTVISSGVEPAGRGIEAAHERSRAYLVLPVAALLQPGPELVWDISWK